MTGWLRWLALPLAAAVLLGASSPAIAQRVPRFLFPALAIAGGGLLVLSAIRAALDLRRGARRSAVGLAVIAVATLLFAVLPFARFVYMMAPPRVGPRILTGFGDRRGAEGYPLLDPHRGIDVKGRVGTDVLAAADGRITVARDSQDLCGSSWWWSTIRTATGPSTATWRDRGERRRERRRGQRSAPGTRTARVARLRARAPGAAARPIPRICTTRPRIVGCFDTTARYPVDRLALTYPVPC